MNIPIVISINPELLKRELTKDQIFDFILDLDASIAELDFTEKLIIQLIKSIRDDISETEWLPYKNLLHHLEEIEIPY